MTKSSYFAFLAIIFLWTGVGWGDEEPQAGIAYLVKFKGDRSGGIRQEVKKQASVWRLRDQPPITLGQLSYRMEQDRATIATVLESEGYYDAVFDVSLNTNAQPIEVEIDIALREPYRYRRVELTFLGQPDAELARIKTRLHKGDRVESEMVFDAEKQILNEVKQQGYPFPKLAKRTVNVDRTEKQVDVLLTFDPGTKAYFGPVDVSGLDTLEDTYVRRQLPWKSGDHYDQRLVDRLQRRLLESGLFSRVQTAPTATATNLTSIPIDVALREREKRTVQLGVGISDIGPEVKAFWEHRSIFGAGERFESSVEWNPINFGGKIQLSRPGFLDANQYLILESDAFREHPDAYDARKIRGTAMVRREFNSMLWGGLGIGYRHSLVEQTMNSERFGQILFPVEIEFDGRNDRLNPVRGMQFFGQLTYAEDTLGAEGYLKSRLEARHYAMLSERHRLSSALRLCLGSIDGTGLGGIPADDRFYAGGGGSVRGYEYQSIGTVANQVPTGGDKLLEFSAELRMQPGQKLGYVLFLDGGTAYNGTLSGLDQSLRYGAGIGLRWFTPIGPLRMDAAYPLNPADNQDERLQVYISLGQAF